MNGNLPGAVPPPPPPHGRSPERRSRPWVWPVVTVAALVAGGGIGYAVADSGGNDDDLNAEVERIAAERDDLVDEKNDLASERDALASERDDLQTQLEDALGGAAQSSDHGEDQGTSDDSEEDEAEESANGDGDGDGTRDNPYSIGTLVGNDEWEVELGEPFEAWDEILAENEFNDQPADGMEYWIVPVTATYVGGESGTAAWDLEVKFVGDDNRTYSDYCGVIPDDLMDFDELYADGTAEGNVCVAVPEGASGLWTLAVDYSAPVFFVAE